MGTFGGYTGQTYIKEEQKEQFTRQIMKILNYGGMMSFEAINMYGSELGLLIPAKIFSGGECRIWYNYFEDTSWETAGFNASDCDFWSNKIGSQEFDDVVTAANFLYEVYDGNPGFVEINGETVHSTEYVGWINHLLGTGFPWKSGSGCGETRKIAPSGNWNAAMTTRCRTSWTSSLTGWPMTQEARSWRI